MSSSASHSSRRQSRPTAGGTGCPTGSTLGSSSRFPTGVRSRERSSSSDGGPPRRPSSTGLGSHGSTDPGVPWVSGSRCRRPSVGPRVGSGGTDAGSSVRSTTALTGDGPRGQYQRAPDLLPRRPSTGGGPDPVPNTPHCPGSSAKVTCPTPSSTSRVPSSGGRGPSRVTESYGVGVQSRLPLPSWG